jgi:hypothetical protein
VTSTAVVPQAFDIDLSTPLKEQIRALKTIRDIVAVTDDPKEAASNAQKARLVREWVKIQKLARELAVEATRLEMTALRRLAQLDALTSLSPAHKSAAKGFAAMTDVAFEATLQVAGDSSSAIAVWRHVQHDGEVAEGVVRGRQIAQGDRHDPISVDSDELSEAASTVLAAALAADRNVSVTEAALALAEALGMADDFHNSAAVRSGLREAIRSALHNDTEMVEGAPNFVTYKNEEAGWVHVPFNIATIEQVKAWAAFRQAQAQDHVAAAAEAMALAHKLETAQKANPGITSARKLWKLVTDALKK